MLIDGKEKIEGFLIRETPTTLSNPEIYEGYQKASDVVKQNTNTVLQEIIVPAEQPKEMTQTL